MNARTVEGRAMNADELDFTPHKWEALTASDVERCFRASDFADRALSDAIDSVMNLAHEVADEARPALIAAHMHASALAYLAERFAGARVPASAPANTTDA
ncbi:hypothetical protein [Acidovorax radicis]|jgi:hypothetical protein|uniref:hypothetical protein n=1 Tax=Acidovorax radicis TaxID=758826 RepID=UPI001CF8324A|nr:hypothetical protein [Acidovorax radicis]UCU98224.1 hypothetical protein KI609_17110 [Acidovorax radicis]